MSLAYRIFGHGRTLVAIPPAAQNIEVAWEQPLLRRMFSSLGSFFRFLHFDKRGTGMSDPSVEVASLDERVDDLRAVLERAEARACEAVESRDEQAGVDGADEGGGRSISAMTARR